MSDNNLSAVVQQQEAFSRMPVHNHGLNAGAVAIESERAIAEAQGQLTLAKKFPRSVTAAITEFMDACKSPEFAKTAFYAVPNRGSGPSIRLAEEAARCYGNFVYGHRELSRSEGKSEIEVYAWDMEKNNRSSRQITVMHVMDTKNGPRKLIDQTDIDNKIANVASKQMRGRILALMPKHMIAQGIEQAKLTLAGGTEKPISERLIAMAAAFSKFGVTNTMLAERLGHPVDQTTIDELADLMGVFNAIKEGAKASDYFNQGDKPKTDATAEGLKSTAANAPAPKVKAEADKAQQNAAPTPQAEAPATTQRQPRRNAAQNESNVTKESAPAPDANASQDKPAEQTQAKPEATPADNKTAGPVDDVF